jgi:diamine N-acetyltransferase
VEVIRRLRLEPEVEMVVTSHRHDNAVVAALFRSLGFVAWELDDVALKPGEVYGVEKAPASRC